MRIRTLCVGMVGMFLLAAVSGCQSERESAYSGMISILDQIADRLSKIKSNTDLADAKPDLQKLGAKMKDQAKALDKLGEPTADERQALEKKYKSKMEQATTRLHNELERLAKEVDDSAPLEALAALNINPMEMQGLSLQ